MTVPVSESMNNLMNSLSDLWIVVIFSSIGEASMSMGPFESWREANTWMTEEGLEHECSVLPLMSPATPIT